MTLRIAILEVDADSLSATGIRGRAMAAFLRARGHRVSVLHPAPGFLERASRARISLRSRLARRLRGATSLPHLWDVLAAELRPQIERGGFDVVIGRGQHAAHATAGMAGFRKVLDAPNVEFLEGYYAASPDLVEVEATFDREEALLRDVHHVLVPHPLLQALLVEAFPRVEGLRKKLVTVGLGAEPARRQACFAAEPRIVYAGSSYYFQDPLLLSRLAALSPFSVECYGPRDPNRRFLPTPLRYRGYAPDAGFLSDYQFGLITVSRDRLREYSPVTKLAYYLMHGLPVLFPEWMREGHELPECAVPYDEDTFVERVREASARPRWEALAAAARSAGAGRSWERVLQPLAELLERPVKVGFLHPEGVVGDRVRIDAIRTFFQGEGIPFREFPLELPPLRADMAAEAFSWTGMRHVARKLLRDRSHSVLKEIHWSLEARRCEEAAAALASRLRREADDVDVFQAEGITEGIACVALLEARGIPFVLDMHGIAAEEARLVGSREWAEWCRRSEQRVVSAARDVLVVSPLSRDYVHRSYGKPLERIHVVPNGTHLDDQRAAVFRTPLTVVYAGNLAPYENVMEFARLAGLAAPEGFRFWLLGDGVLREPLLDYVNSRGVDLVYFGRKTRTAALDRCARAQVGFAGQSGALDLERDHPRQLACPIKLFDYASCGLPLVAPRGEWSAILEEADCGVIVETCEAPAYLEALRQLSDPVVWSRKARNGLELVRSRFQWSQVLEPLRALYARS